MENTDNTIKLQNAIYIFKKSINEHEIKFRSISINKILNELTVIKKSDLISLFNKFISFSSSNDDFLDNLLQIIQSSIENENEPMIDDEIKENKKFKKFDLKKKENESEKKSEKENRKKIEEIELIKGRLKEMAFNPSKQLKCVFVILALSFFSFNGNKKATKTISNFGLKFFNDNIKEKDLDYVFSRFILLLNDLSNKDGLIFSFDKSFLMILLDKCRRFNKTYSLGVVINLILEKFLHFNDIDQAELIQHCITFPKTKVDFTEKIKNIYLKAFIKASQSKFKESFHLINKAFSKAPKEIINQKKILNNNNNEQNKSNSFFLNNFPETLLIKIAKLHFVLSLINDKSTQLSSKILNKTEKKSVEGYFLLKDVLNNGRINEFDGIFNKNVKFFEEDGLCTLTRELKTMAIKIKIKNLSKVYSIISLKDLSKKLYCLEVQKAKKMINDLIKKKEIKAHFEGDYLVKNNFREYCKTGEPTFEFEKRINKNIDLCYGIENCKIYPLDDESVKNTVIKMAEIDMLSKKLGIC